MWEYMKNPIMAALDVSDERSALDLAEKIRPFVGGFKIGSELFVSAGPNLIKALSKFERKIFLDLKFHDIPNTVHGAVASAVRLGVDLLTVHAFGGSQMIRSAVSAARSAALSMGRPVPTVLAVTMLTSLNETDLEELGVNDSPKEFVRRLAGLALKAGAGGVVCSPLEIDELRQSYGSDFTIVAPGIRFVKTAEDDQKRTMNPSEALKAGADWIVVGRPIYQTHDPASAAKSILDMITE
jgi:orotidine-5'-phosphate decarboxylase